MMHSIEIERRVLQILMSIGDFDDERVHKAFLDLTPACFHFHELAEIFGMIKANYANRATFGFVCILSMLPKKDEDLYYAFKCILDDQRHFPLTTSTLDADVTKLVAYSILRKQHEVALKLVNDIQYCKNPEATLSVVTSRITQISNLTYNSSSYGLTGTDLADAYYSGMLAKDLVLKTTCAILNAKLNGGVISKSLITVAAGAGVGKTGFAIFLLDCIARFQPERQSLFFSLEMEAKHIWMRHVGICGKKKFDKLTEEEREDAIVSSLNVPMTIYDAANCRASSDIDFIITQSRLKALSQPISVIVVDYLGLVQNKAQFERNDLKQSDITTKLANLALELNCVVIALSQINRSAAARSKDDQCPYPSDVADSLGSYRSSTLWIGVDRPELYNDDESYRNQFVIKCRKNRFGENFEMVMAFNEGTFGEVAEGYFLRPTPVSRSSSFRESFK